MLVHGDLDGLTAGAILYDVLLSNGRKVSIRITQPFNLYQTLRDLKIIKSLERLYILDIGIDEVTWKQAMNELKEIAEKGVKIVWIDHHVATLKHFFELMDMGISLLFESERCAVSMVSRAFMHMTSDPDFYEKLVIIGEVGDKVRRIGERHPLFSIVEVLGSSLAYMPSDDEFKISLIKMWVNKKRLVSDEVVLRAESAAKKLEELLREAERRVVYSGDKMVLVDMRDVKIHGYAGKIASHVAGKTDKVVFLAFNTDHETIITCRVPPSRNFNALEMLPKLAEKYSGGGGGHEKAASIRVPAAMFEKVIQDLKSIEASIG